MGKGRGVEGGRTRGSGLFRPELEILEDRRLLTLIPVTTHRDLIADGTGSFLYITTSTGTVERWNISTQALQTPLTVGTELWGGDITPDDGFLYVAEDRPSGSQGIFHRVNLATGTATDVPYPLGFAESGAWDIAITCRDTALTDGQFAGSGWVEFRKLDLTTGTYTTFTGPHSSVRQNSLIARSADRSVFAVNEDNISSGPIFTYSALTDTFPASTTTGSFLRSAPSVDRNGTLIARVNGGDLIVYNSSFTMVRTITGGDAGQVFDPIRDILYVADSTTDQITAYDTRSWSTLFSFAVGEDISSAGSFGDGVMAISGNGNYLFLATPLGVQQYDLRPTSQSGVRVIQTAGCTDVAEGGAVDRYSLVLTKAPTANVIVTLAPNAQATVSRTTVTFTPANWSTAQTVTVTAVDDALVEGTHLGLVQHTVGSADVSYGGIGVNAVHVEITDNDNPAVVVAASGGSTTIAEGAATDTYTIVLNATPTANVTIAPSPSAQVTVSTPSVVFTLGNWNIPQTVTVTAVDDAIIEGIHTGVVTHAATSTDTNFNALAVPSVTATITDNDFPPGVNITPSGGATTVIEGGTTDTYTAVLNTRPTANVVVNLTASSPQVTLSTPSLTFTVANWNIAQTVTITAIEDALIEGTQSAVISHAAVSTDLVYNAIAIASVTATILDNDGGGVTILDTGGSTDVVEGGATDRYTVVLIQAPISNVIVSLNPDSQVTVSPTALTFTPANWNLVRTVVVTAVDDAFYESSHAGIIQHTLSSADPAYSSLVLADITANIADNDPAPGVALSTTSVDVAESGIIRTYTIKLLSQPVDTVTIDLLPDPQVTVSPAALVFTGANWNTVRTVTVSALNDLVYEGPHTGIITHSATSLDPGYDAIAVEDVTADIADNDLPPGVVITSAGPFTLVEGAAQVYTMVLSSPPSTDVTVTPLPDSQLLVNPAEEVFTKYNWNIPHTLTLAVIDDLDINGYHSGVISHSATSADPNYDGIAVADVNVNILDNDGATLAGTAGNDKILVTYSTGQATASININGKTTLLPISTSQLVLQAGLGNDSIQVTEPPFPVVILGGGGKDTVTILGRASSNDFILADAAVAINSVDVTVWDSESLIVAGKKSNDTFTVTAMPKFPVEFKGDLGTDQVTGPEQFNTWNITGLSAGTLNKTIKLTAIESLTGGSDADAFWFSAGKGVAGIIDGGGGYDVLDYSLYTTPAVVNLQTNTATGTGGFANIVKFRGGKGSDKLIGLDQSNQWNVTALNVGDVNGIMAFEGVENLTGGNQDDTFLLANVTGVKGKIDGGLGDDVLDYSSYLSLGVTVNLQTRTATNTGGWLALEQFIAGNGTSDILIGANRQNLWTLSGANSGNVNGNLFAAFENLTGGSVYDTFNLDVFGYWTGTLNGGAGTDTINASTAFNNVYLVPTGSNAGTLNGRRFLNVEKRQ